MYSGLDTYATAMTTAAWVRPSWIPNAFSVVAEQPEPAERGDQSDPRDGGRQDERQLDEHDRERASPKAARRNEVRGRRAEKERECLRDRARLQADHQGIGLDGA